MGRKTEDCSSLQYLLEKGSELQIKEAAYFCVISIFSKSVLCVCEGGRDKTKFWYCFLYYVKLTITEHYGELSRPKWVTQWLARLQEHELLYLSVLPTAIMLFNLGYPPPPQKGRTSVYNGLGNKNPVRDY